MLVRILSRALIYLGMALYALRLHRFVIRLNGAAPRVLLLHGCEAQESPDIEGLRSNTTPVLLGRFLTHLKEHYTVVALDTLGRPDGPATPVVITFDDGYRSVFDQAVPILRAHDVTATTYLVTDAIEGDHTVWVNEVRRLMYEGHKAVIGIIAAAAKLPEDALPRDLIDGLRQRMDVAGMRELLRQLRECTGESGGASHSRLHLTWDEVHTMTDWGFQFGNHTGGHLSLPGLTSKEKREEITRASRALADHGVVARSFAYPFGDRDEAAEGIVHSLGFDSVVLVGGANRQWDPLRIARIPVHAQGVAELFAEMEVLNPVKSWIKGLIRRR